MTPRLYRDPCGLWVCDWHGVTAVGPCPASAQRLAGGVVRWLRRPMFLVRVEAVL